MDMISLLIKAESIRDSSTVAIQARCFSDALSVRQNILTKIVRRHWSRVHCLVDEGHRKTAQFEQVSEAFFEALLESDAFKK